MVVKRLSAGAARVQRVARGAARAVLLAAASAFAAVEFRHIVFDSPLDVPAPGEDATEAVRQFHATGENPYDGDADAVAKGKRLFQQWCAACHAPDATGNIGPSLVDEKALYPRTETDVGLFETIYGGALGAMQSFGGRIPQDDILKIIAHINELRKDR